MRIAIGTGIRVALFLLVIAVLVIAPLFLVYRSKCVEDGKRVDSWSLVAPWDDPPSECRRHESGFEVLRDEAGI